MVQKKKKDRRKEKQRKEKKKGRLKFAPLPLSKESKWC